MEKQGLNDIFKESINTLLNDLPQKYHFRLHRIFNPTPTPKEWGIEKNGINTDLHLLYVIEGNGFYYSGEEASEIALKKGKIIFVSNGFAHSAKPNRDNLPHTFSIRFGVYDNITN